MEAESGQEFTNGERLLNILERKREMRRKVNIIDVGINFVIVVHPNLKGFAL